MNLYSLETVSRKSTVKVLLIGSYAILFIDIIQGIAFIPLYIYFIGERLYGIWLASGGILALLALFDLGIASLIIQRVSREFGKKSYEGVSRYFSSGILINSLLMLLLFLVGIFLSSYTSNFFENLSIIEKRIIVEAFQIALVALIITLFNGTIEGTLNALQKPLISKIAQFGGAILSIVVVYVLLKGDSPLIAIPMSIFVRSIFCLFINFVYLYLLFKRNGIMFFNIDKIAIHDYLTLFPSLLLSKIGTSVLGNIEPTLISIFISPETAVHFSITQKGGSIIRMILDRIGGILFPSMAHLYAEESKINFKTFCINLFSYIFPFCIILFGLYVVFNKYFITIWVGQNNYLGGLITIIIALSLFSGFLSNFLSYLLGTTGDIKFSSNLIFWESILKVILLIILLLMFGMYGLPTAFFIVSLIFVVYYFKRWNMHLQLSLFEIKQLILNQIKTSGSLILFFGISFYVVNYFMFYLNVYEILLCIGFNLFSVFIILVSTNNGFRSIFFNYLESRKFQFKK